MTTIRIDNRSIPAATYLAGIRAAKAHPEQRFSSSLRGRLEPATGAEIMQQYRDDLQQRINRRGGSVLAGIGSYISCTVGASRGACCSPIGAWSRLAGRMKSRIATAMVSD